MRIKIRNKLTSKRVKVLIGLIVIETFLTPLNRVLSTGAWPTIVELCHFAVTAGIQGVTLAVGLLERS